MPNNWVVTNLAHAGIWKAGSTPNRANPAYYNGSICWLKTGELNDNLCINSSEEHITQLAMKQCNLKFNEIGNVLVAMYGATIGKLGICAIEATTNQACCGCKPYKGIFNKFLFYFILSERDNLIKLGYGGAQPNISKDKIISYPFFLPPYNEQLKIVAKLEQIINIID